MFESDKTLMLKYVTKAVRTLANTCIHSVQAERQYTERKERKFSSHNKGKLGY